jgi:gamma-glutamylcyclotransferase (GGCT)/AIG2-like uncharacterized protein YtfP
MELIMLYFAYGMNTNIQEMVSRCPQALDLGTAYLQDYKMVFKYHADMIQSPGTEAPGVLWSITPDCLEALDILEGYPVYYLRKTVEVCTEEGKLVDALMYYMPPGERLREPSAGYYDLVLQGYDQHGIPEHHLVAGLPEILNYAD